MKKIMFNDRYNLTQAVLEGRKTQTRRMIPKGLFSLTWDVRGDTLVYENEMGDFIDIRNSKYACYKVGELVAVAQSYRDCGGVTEERMARWNIIASKVSGTNAGWDNKMFVRADLMPHQIRITDVRVEHLQDISDDDCLKEGVELNTRQFECDGTKYYCVRGLGHWRAIGCDNFDTPREAFAALINKVSKADVWSENPYVFVYDFELIK